MQTANERPAATPCEGPDWGLIWGGNAHLYTIPNGATTARWPACKWMPPSSGDGAEQPVCSGVLRCSMQPGFGNPLACTFRWFIRPAGLRQPGSLLMQPLSAACANLSASGWGPIHGPCCASAVGPHGTSACASSATCMLFMTRDMWSLKVMPCSLCGFVTLLCSALLGVPCSCLCSCSYSSKKLPLWG